MRTLYIYIHTYTYTSTLKPQHLHHMFLSGHCRRGRHRVDPQMRHGAVRAAAQHAEVEEVRGRHGGAGAASDDAAGDPWRCPRSSRKP